MSEENAVAAWVAATPEEYDLTAEFQAEVMPIMVQLGEMCKKHGMPYYARVVFASKDGTSKNSVGYGLGGPTRATPELMLYALVSQFSKETIDQVEELVALCKVKYGHVNTEEIMEQIQAIKLDPDNPDASVQAIDALITKLIGE